MGSGLIYLIIIGMWIAYFLPRWISNHEEISGRSVKRFDEAMKVVGMSSGHTAPDIDSLNKKRDRAHLHNHHWHVDCLLSAPLDFKS